jgi:hypothetical protein
MSTQINTKHFIIGNGLVAAGAVMSAIGFLGVVAQALPIFVIGAGLIAVGLLVALQAAHLSTVKAIIVGATLTVTGVAMTVLAATIEIGNATNLIITIGGAIFVAGTLQVINASSAIASSNSRPARDGSA